MPGKLSLVERLEDEREELKDCSRTHGQRSALDPTTAQRIANTMYEAAAEIERLTAALSRAEAQREALVKALVLAGERLEVAAERVDRADTEFGFRTWAHEARHAAIDNGLAGDVRGEEETKERNE